MIRKCDGADPNLVMRVEAGTDKKVTGPDRALAAHGIKTETKPCNCGKVFDDVDHFVYWPHAQF